jgi:ATP-binding cassette, subfamily C (CFTR/MRP), member 4
MNDQRIKFTNEVIEGIRLIKMYAWEKAFQSICNSYRALEYKFITSQFYLYMLDRSISKSLGLISFLVTIVFVHFFSDKLITLAEIFPTI